MTLDRTLSRGAELPHSPTIEDYGIPSYPTVVVTGPRFWNSLEGRDLQLRRSVIERVMTEELEERGPFTLVHGNAYGLDKMCAAFCEMKLMVETIKVPYFGWMGRAGGQVRNRFMLTAYTPRTVHGFHDKPFEELPRPGSGTAGCFQSAIDLGVERCWFHVTGRYSRLYVPEQSTLL